jgi:adenylate cyclase
MISPSTEILAVSRRWFNTLRIRNFAAMRDYLSAAEELRFIGTGEGEYWSGNAVREGIGDFFKDVPEFEVWKELEAEAFENGETGWSLFVHRLQLAGFAQPTVFRTVLIFVLEGAAWKIVNRHSSVPTPNIDIVGTEMLAIQQLVDVVRRDGPDLIQTEGLASVLFTDLEGSTALAEALGDQKWSALIDDHFQTIADIVKEHRGQFVKSLGDGTLSCFPSANQALIAAVEMQIAVASATEEPLLGLRIGIHTGDVVQSRGDFFGSVVNKAARITAKAAAGEILVSDTTRAMVGATRAFCLGDSTAVQLKGLDGHHTLHRLEWERSISGAI